MTKQTTIAMVLSSLILGVAMIFSAVKIADSLDFVANVQANQENENEVAKYELIIKDGWYYLYDTTTGQIWRKLDYTEPMPDETWEVITHIND
ncbi:MAG: hypothetical protein UHX00_03935 [Caryophanon sp.]|nr:hypothetical protein [Caryophanon sp.]